MHKSVIKPHAARTSHSRNCPKVVCGRICESMQSTLGSVPTGQVLTVSLGWHEFELHGQGLQTSQKTTQE
jgi:hypothetical protein